MTTICDEFEVWEQQYKPTINDITDPDIGSLIFETYGSEFKYVKQCPIKKVWTWVDGDDGTYIISGLHFVNRIGYFITEKEWQSSMIIAYEKY